MTPSVPITSMCVLLWAALVVFSDAQSTERNEVRADRHQILDGLVATDFPYALDVCQCKLNDSLRVEVRNQKIQEGLLSQVPASLAEEADPHLTFHPLPMQERPNV
ncbi:unnamed protein product [Darwinula stevensoni]|uniref:Uncharacterized protein n=1 Tax=Darwinula stevensoni TaxID=69355 RepID=A0A7R9FSD4_9CRUS|nr:unnamed protein product [Darwinula stevensoni]CAG0902398.1 unnamed protein product [Darwinula stevensoni]